MAKKKQNEESRELSDAVKVEMAMKELERLRHMQQLLGDPRVRVEVPTDGKAGQQHSFPTARRYSLT